MTQNISFIVAQISAYVCKICIDRLSIIEQIHGINHLTSISFTGSPITDARNCLGLASLNLASCLLCVSEIMRLILSANTLASSIQPIFLKRLRLLRRVFTNGVTNGQSLGPIVTYLTGINI